MNIEGCPHPFLTIFNALFKNFCGVLLLTCTFELGCNNYIIRDKPSTEDAFHLEMEAFLESIKKGKTPYPLSIYLDAIEVANEIIEKIHKKD